MNSRVAKHYRRAAETFPGALKGTLYIDVPQMKDKVQIGTQQELHPRCERGIYRNLKKMHKKFI